MFGWKKRDEGFEWREYVRTTIKLRREARREKAFQVGQNVAAGAKAAGAAADDLARKGASSLGRAAQMAAASGLSAAVAGLRGLGLALGRVTQRLGLAMEPGLDILGRPAVAGPLLLVGLIAMAGGLGRALLAGAGFDGEALTALAIGCIALLVGGLPALWHGHGFLPTGLVQGTRETARNPVALGAVGLAGVVGVTLLVMPVVGVPTVFKLGGLPTRGGLGAKPLTGAATVVSTDTLKIGDTLVRLDGIDVPDPEQRCQRGGTKASGRGWACGEEARSSLGKLVRGQTVSCDVGARASDGRAAGRCRAGGADIGAALVRAGLAFSTGGFAAPYQTEEAEAKSSRAGLWSGAEPERPAQWRERVWLAAKRQAPDGCPIKGRIRDGEKVYLLPWEADYARVRLSPKRGERWFCSEADATAAGWRNGTRG